MNYTIGELTENHRRVIQTEIRNWLDIQSYLMTGAFSKVRRDGVKVETDESTNTVKNLNQIKYDLEKKIAKLSQNYADGNFIHPKLPINNAAKPEVKKIIQEQLPLDVKANELEQAKQVEHVEQARHVERGTQKRERLDIQGKTPMEVLSAKLRALAKEIHKENYIDGYTIYEIIYKLFPEKHGDNNFDDVGKIAQFGSYLSKNDWKCIKLVLTDTGVADLQQSGLTRNALDAHKGQKLWFPYDLSQYIFHAIKGLERKSNGWRLHHVADEIGFKRISPRNLIAKEMRNCGYESSHGVWLPGEIVLEAKAKRFAEMHKFRG